MLERILFFYYVMSVSAWNFAKMMDKNENSTQYRIFDTAVQIQNTCKRRIRFGLIYGIVFYRINGIFEQENSDNQDFLI